MKAKLGILQVALFLPFILSSFVLTLRLGRAQSFSLHISAPWRGAFRRHSATSCYSFTEPTEEDMNRWGRMYGDGRSSDTSSSKKELSISQRSEVRVVSFDLDNTLWETSATIAAANDALAAFLDENNIVQPKRVEKIMGELFQRDKERYCPIEKEDAKAPVLLTLLRKDAIRQILRHHNDYGEEDASTFADRAFAEWTQARHDAIPSYLASSVKPCLEEIASLRTTRGHRVLIGAITDGNSDPSLIDELSDYFDFCINAEMVGISKPDKRVYLQAVAKAVSHPSLEDLHVDRRDKQLTDEVLEELLGPWWIHIGDDFVKDVVAAKSLNMRSIWAQELVKEKLRRKRQQSSAKSSDRSVEELVKQVSEMKVIEMQVGADDYLTNALEDEFADAITDKFGELGRILQKWHNEALGDSMDSPADGPAVEEDPPLAIPSVEPNAASFVEEELRQKIATIPEAVSTAARDKKFCLFCGEKLPVVAKFCSSCGEKQPDLTS